MSEPRLSLILVCPKGWSDLVLALPGLQAQTIAKDIELILAAKPGLFPNDINDRIEGLHSVRIVETTEFIPRGAAVIEAIAKCRAPFIGPHENHSYAEAETYEKLLDAMGENTGCIAPIYYCLNAEARWAAATSVVTHGHAAAPVTGESRRQLTLHHAVYPADVLKPRAELFRDENILHQTLYDEGFKVHFLPGTVLWHLEAGTPSLALAIAHVLGRQFGWHRSREMANLERIGRLLALPLVVLVLLKHYLGMLMSLDDLRTMRLAVVPHVSLLAGVFAIGEVHGYFTKNNPWPRWIEEHEYDLIERLEGKAPERRAVIDAVARINDPIPDPIPGRVT